MRIQIVCIKKDGGNHENPYAAISELGWINPADNSHGQISREGLWHWLEDKKGEAYVKDSRGNIAYVGTATTERGTKYVRTYADRVWTDNLLSLPECRV